MKEKENLLDLAIAQFIGFGHAKMGYSIRELASSMGLKKSEWNKIRKEPMSLTESEIKEVDEYFKTEPNI